MTIPYPIYFSDRARSRVVEWKPSSGRSRTFGEGMLGPYGLAFDAQGRLLIADKGNNRILRHEGEAGLTPIAYRCADGHRRARIARLTDQPAAPSGLWVEPDGSILVAFSDDHTIYRIRKGGLELVVGVPAIVDDVVSSGLRATVPEAQVKTTPLRMPTAVVGLADRSIVFIERGVQEVRRYRPGIGIESIFGGRLSGRRGSPDDDHLDDFEIQFPSAVAVDAQGRLFVADSYHRRVWQVSLTERTKKTVVRTDPAVRPGYAGPSAITFGPDNSLWVLDYATASVMGYRETAQGTWDVLPWRCDSVDDVRLTCQSLQGAGIACGAAGA